VEAVTYRNPERFDTFRQMSENVVRRTGSLRWLVKIRPPDVAGHFIRCSLRA